jgi:hypothetical protein
MNKDEILDQLIEKWGEHLEMSDDPAQMIIDILLNTVSEQQETIVYLRRVNVSINSTK